MVMPPCAFSLPQNNHFYFCPILCYFRALCQNCRCSTEYHSQRTSPKQSRFFGIRKHQALFVLGCVPGLWYDGHASILWCCGFRWGVVTNGYQMTYKRFDRLLKSGMQALAISLDGKKKSHDWFRGKKGSFERAFETIIMASAASRKGLGFDVVSCIHKRNLDELDGLKQLLMDAGVSRWRLVSIFPKGRAQCNENLKLSGTQLKSLFNFIKATRKEGKIIASYGCEGFLGSYEMEVRDIPFSCRAGMGIGSVLVDGAISACPSLRQDFIQGNIYQDDFMDVWNNCFQVMRNRNWAKTGECRLCRMWTYCKGNGLHLRSQKTGKLLYCQYNELKHSKKNMNLTNP